MQARWLILPLLLGLACEEPSPPPPPPPPEQPDDPYADLPIVDVVDGAFTVGPDGGHAILAGFELEFPRGALDEDVEITARPSDNPPPAVYGPPLAGPIQLLPAGLYFTPPVRLTLETNRDLPPPAKGGLGYFVLTTPFDPDNPDDAEDETVPVLDAASGPRRILALLSHFSEVSAVESRTGASVAETLGRCATAPVVGITDDIRRTFVGFDGVDLLPLPIGEGVRNNDDPLRPPYASPALVASLRANVVGAPEALPVNSAWRSVVQQLVLKRCRGRNATANLGSSFHGIGAALDVQGDFEICDNATTTRDDLHPVWGPRLDGAANGFNWFGNNNPVCADKPHFTHTESASSDQLALAVLAFQTLWDNRMPCAPTPADELAQLNQDQLGTTIENILQAPADGFADIVPLQLPAEGGGCTTPDAMCCPADVDNDAPFCAETCPDLIDAGPDAGELDAGLDAGAPDAGVPDAGAPDAGPVIGQRLYTASWTQPALVRNSAAQLVDGFAGVPEMQARPPDPASGIEELNAAGIAVDGSGNVWVASCAFLGGPGHPELVRYDAGQLVSGDINPTPAVVIDLTVGGECAVDLAFGPGGRLYIATSDDLAVLEPGQLNASATITPILVEHAGVSTSADGVAVAPDGSIWVTFFNVRTIYRYTVDQTLVSGAPTPTRDWSGPLLSGPTDVMFAPDGMMWVADFNNNQVYGFDAAGQASPTLPVPVRILSSPDLLGPENGTFDDEGNLWLPNQLTQGTNVVMFTAAALAAGGTQPAAITITGPEVDAPYSVALDPPPSILFAP